MLCRGVRFFNFLRVGGWLRMSRGMGLCKVDIMGDERGFRGCCEVVFRIQI